MKNIKPLTPVVGFSEMASGVLKTVYGRLIHIDKQDDFPYFVYDKINKRNDFCYDVQEITEEQLIEYLKLERGSK